jgi:hypothetical protein
MAVLVSNEKLAELNIDTIERAIVFATLALQAAIANTESNESLIEKVLTTFRNNGKTELTLAIDVYLPVDTYRFSRLGGNIINSLTTLRTDLVDLESQLDFTVNPSSVIVPEMVTYSSELDNNFETYFYYYVSILYASLTENRNDIIRINPELDNPDNAEVRVRINLPIDAKRWALGNNLVDSVLRVTDSYETTFTVVDDEEISTAIDDSTPLGDESILGD